MTESVLDLLRKPDLVEEPTKETTTEKLPTKVMTTKKAIVTGKQIGRAHV